MAQQSTLYAVSADGLSAKPVTRRRLAHRDSAGVWWCPYCDTSQQDAIRTCGRCGATLADYPPDLQDQARKRLAAAEEAYGKAVQYALSIGALQAETVSVNDAREISPLVLADAVAKHRKPPGRPRKQKR